jgi:hypothetical protein
MLNCNEIISFVSLQCINFSVIFSWVVPFLVEQRQTFGGLGLKKGLNWFVGCVPFESSYFVGG